MVKIKSVRPLRSPTTVREEEFDTRQMLLNVNRRMQTAVIASAVATAAAAGSLLFLMPLKQTVPYVLEVNKTTGEVVAPQQQPASAYSPDWNVKMFFIRSWITNLLSINQYTFKTTDPAAQYLLRGNNAIAEFKQFRAEDGTYQNLVDHPNMVRNVDIRQVTPVAGTNNGIVAQVHTTTMKGGQVSTQDWLLTVYWTFIVTQTPEDVRHNPAGLWVTDFKVSRTSSAAPSTP
jgi:type IV secretion system protein VirB8